MAGRLVRTPSAPYRSHERNTRASTINRGRFRRYCVIFALFFALGRLSEFRFGLYMKLDQYIDYSIVVSSSTPSSSSSSDGYRPKVIAANLSQTNDDTLAAINDITSPSQQPLPPVQEQSEDENNQHDLPAEHRIAEPELWEAKSQSQSRHSTAHNPSPGSTDSSRPSKYLITPGGTAAAAAADTAAQRRMDQSNSPSSLFLLLSSPRCGASWVLTRLNQHESLCASGTLPLDALQASSSTATTNECTLAWMHKHLNELDFITRPESSSTSQSSMAAMPSQCDPGYNDLTNDNSPLNPHQLRHLCAYAERLGGNYSLDAISQLYMDDFVNVSIESNKEDVSCAACQSGEHVRGVRILTADWIPNVLQQLEQTIAVGAKVIRLTRHNYFELYMSNLVPSTTNIWWIANDQDKANQLDAFAKLNYAINVDDMLSQIRKFQASDAINDAWLKSYGGETLWVDFSQVRDEPDEAFTAMTRFLQVEEESAGETSLVRRRLNLHSTGSLTKFNYKMLMDSIANADIVQEALCANGFGHFIGVHDCEPMYHLIFLPAVTSLRMPTSRRGLDVVILNPSTSQKKQGEKGAKFHAARSSLQSLPPDSIVILSEGDNGSLNHHIRSQPDYYKALAATRSAVKEMERDHPGAILVPASGECCSRLLPDGKPSSFFDTNGKCIMRTCKGDEFSENGETNVKGTYFLDGSIIAGTASALIQFVDALPVEPWEDDHVALTDFMNKHPGRVKIDHDRKVFGKRFDGVTSKLHPSCKAPTSDAFVQTASPLFVYSSQKQLCLSERETKSFPAWEEAGIAIQSILDHTDQLFVHSQSVEGIDLHFDKEVLYIVDLKGVWGTPAVRDDLFRVSPSEDLLSWTHDEMLRMSENEAGLHRWRSLHKTLRGSGFPYWAWYGDWKNCNHRNMGDNSIPIFTTCAEVTCSHSFPTPSYMHVIDSQPEATDWYSVFGQYDNNFPWEDKIRKVVWRGALSENNPSKVFDSQRWRLCKLVHELTDSVEKDMFDVGLTTIPEFLTFQIDIDESLVGGVVKTLGAMHEFQKYSAILDMDGNSWSSRFRTMLCYNSVAIKMEPAYVDYFFSDLVPWKHYIPVKNDLSDLLENVAFALDPANDALIHEIISSANLWCSERSTHQGLVYDMLDTMESYVQLLDRADPKWPEEWNRKKQDLMAPSSNIPLIRLK